MAIRAGGEWVKGGGGGDGVCGTAGQFENVGVRRAADGHKQRGKERAAYDALHQGQRPVAWRECLENVGGLDIACRSGTRRRSRR